MTGVTVEVLGMMNHWSAFVVDNDNDVTLAATQDMNDWMVVRNTGIGLDTIIAMTEVVEKIDPVQHILDKMIEAGFICINCYRRGAIDLYCPACGPVGVE